ncbi:hypothetical protein SB00610_01110 [Klebsiella quasipneumoniae subsp. similipneumoniae]|nr:hypothetical protein SB00610_01110 [Klebsiella quasipneumoniae subsp. similipneumoniae]
MVQITKVGFLPIADIEQVAQHGDGITLLARPQQLADRHIEHLAEQIEQRGLQRRYRVDFQFKGPRPFAKGVEIRRLIAFVYLLHHAIQSGDLLTYHLRDRRQQRLVDNLTARGFAHAGVAGVIGQHHDIAGKPGVMRPTDVQQHAVVSGHRNDLHLCDNRAGLGSHD